MSLVFKLAGVVLDTVPVPGPEGSGTAWSLVEAAEKGTAAIGTFHADDEDASRNLLAHAPLRVTESAASPTMIAAGYLTTRGISRGTALQMASARVWEPQVVDLNVLLTDRIIETGGKRPAETDIERIDWILASSYLPIGDAGYIDRSSPTSMPEADYTGRAPADVLSDCSNESGRNYFVRWEDCAVFPDHASPWYPSLPAGGIGWADSAIHGSSVSGTFWQPGQPLTGSLADIVDGIANTDAQIVDDLNWSGATQYDTLTFPAAATFGSLTMIFGLLPGDGPSDVYTMDELWQVLVDGSPVPGSWSALYQDLSPTNVPLWTPLTFPGDLDSQWAVPVSAIQPKFWVATWRPTAGSVSSTATIGLLRSIPNTMDGPGNYNLVQVLVPGSICGPGPALGYHDSIWSGDSSSIRISNDPAEIDNVTTFAVPPDVRLDRDPARIFSGCHYEYSGGSVYATNPTTKTTYFTLERFGRDDRASDMNCTTLDTAARLATAYLERAANEEGVLSNAILMRMTSAQVNLARQGQRIQVHLTHEPGLEAFTWMAITQRTVTPFAPGLYDVALTVKIPVLTGFRGGGFGFADPVKPAEWVHNTALVIAPAPPDPTQGLPGQRTTPTFVAYGDGTTVLFTLPVGYLPGSLWLWVDAQPITTASITEIDPAAGTFSLDFAPVAALGAIAAQELTASWQVA